MSNSPATDIFICCKFQPSFKTIARGTQWQTANPDKRRDMAPEPGICSSLQLRFFRAWSRWSAQIETLVQFLASAFALNLISELSHFLINKLQNITTYQKNGDVQVWCALMFSSQFLDFHIPVSRLALASSLHPHALSPSLFPPLLPRALTAALPLPGTLPSSLAPSLLALWLTPLSCLLPLSLTHLLHLMAPSLTLSDTSNPPPLSLAFPGSLTPAVCSLPGSLLCVLSLSIWQPPESSKRVLCGGGGTWIMLRDQIWTMGRQTMGDLILFLGKSRPGTKEEGGKWRK